MARNIRKKLIYKDRATGKLIPKKLADQRDPSTWVEEEFVLTTDDNIVDSDDSAASMTENEAVQDLSGEDEDPPLLTQSV